PARAPLLRVPARELVRARGLRVAVLPRRCARDRRRPAAAVPDARADRRLDVHPPARGVPWPPGELLRDGAGRVGSADRGMAPRARRLRLLQQRLGGLRDQERAVVEAAIGRLARLVPMEPSRDEILKALEQVIDPELRRPVTELDMVREVRVEGGNVAVTIALTVAGCPLRSSFENQVSEHLLPLPGVESVSLDFDVMSPDERAALTQRLRGGITERTKGISVDAS